LRKKHNGLARQSWAYQAEVLGFLPPGMHRQGNGLNGAIASIGWTPILDPQPHPSAGIPNRAPEEADIGASPKAPNRSPPTAQQLRELANALRHREGALLLDGVDLDAIREPDFCYYAGVCLGTVHNYEQAIKLIKSALAGGFNPFWCAYHLGLFEMRRGKPANAAYYYAAALILNPERTEIVPLLDQVAPDNQSTWLRAVQPKTKDASAANAAFELGVREQQLGAGNVGKAVHYFTLALFLDPEHEKARSQLLTLAPDLFLDLIPGIKPKEHPAAPKTGRAPAEHTELYDAD
jgi:tetratricopeptide (TPR) repeat protein